MTDKVKNYVSKNAFLAMIGLVIAVSAAVYVRHEKTIEHTVVTNYRLIQLENENKDLQKKLHTIKKNLEELYTSLDADGAVDELDEDEKEPTIPPEEK